MIGAVGRNALLDQRCRKVSSMVKTDRSFIFTMAFSLACGTRPGSFAGCRLVSLVSVI